MIEELRSAALAVVLSALLAGGIMTAGCEAEERAVEPRVCGGSEGAACPEGYFCELPEGKCGAADLEGACLERPAVCTREYRPVCGCDGKTYGNDCDRMSKGVQKAHDGECVAD